MFRINLAQLKETSVNRPAGYLEDMLAKGIINGEFLEITKEAYIEMVKKYDPHRLKGLGDVVAIFAQPIAHTIDKVLGTHVAGCQGCKQRQEFLNKVVPFK